MASLSLAFDILARDKASATFDKVGNAAEGTGRKASKLSGIGSALGTALGGAAVAGVAGLGAALFAGAKDAANMERLLAQTSAAIKSTGNAAGVSVSGIDAFATSLEKSTGVEAESIIAGQNLLLTFTNVKNGVGEGNQVFDQATSILTDMSVALGTDASSAATLLGKALNDPVGGVTALTRAGVQLTAGQKEQIAAFVATGDIMGAQKVILGELTNQFGGSAVAFGETLPGQIAKAKNAFGDLFEQLAVNILPTVSAIVVAFTASLPGALAAVQGAFATVGPPVLALGQGLLEVAKVAVDLGSALPTPVLQVFAGAVAAVTVALLAQRAATAISTAATALFAGAKGIATVATVTNTGATTTNTAATLAGRVGLLAHTVATAAGTVATVASTAAKVVGTAATVALTAATTALGVAIRLATGPVGLIITGLALLAGALVAAYKNSETFRNIVNGAFSAVQGAASALVSFVTSTIPAGFARAKDGAASAVGALLSLVGGLPGRIAGALGNLGSLLFSAGGDLLRGLANGIGAAIGGVAAAAKRAAQAVVNAVKGAFKISSPSKVMAALGENVSEGLAVGIDRKAGLAQAALSGLLPPTVATSVSGRPSSAALGAGTTGTSYHLTAIVRDKVNIRDEFHRMELLAGA